MNMARMRAPVKLEAIVLVHCKLVLECTKLVVIVSRFVEKSGKSVDIKLLRHHLPFFVVLYFN